MENEVEKMMKCVGNVEPHYGLRKLSIGVASVLLGMSIYGIVGHADSKVGSLKPVDNSENVNVNENTQSVNVNGNDQVVLQSKNAGNAVSSVISTEGEGTGKRENDSNSAVNDSQSDSVNTLNASSVTSQNNVNNDKANDRIFLQSLADTQNTPQVDRSTKARDIQGGFPGRSDYGVKAPGAEFNRGLSLSFQVDLTGHKSGDRFYLGEFKQISSTNGYIGITAAFRPDIFLPRPAYRLFAIA